MFREREGSFCVSPPTQHCLVCIADKGEVVMLPPRSFKILKCGGMLKFYHFDACLHRDWPGFIKNCIQTLVYYKRHPLL